MGRYKYDTFNISQLSPGTIDAIKNDLIDREAEPQRYDWNVMQVRVKRANMAQRHRFMDTISKLDDYLEGKSDYEYRDFLSFRGFARITGRDVKTIRDWADKGFLALVDLGNEYIDPIKTEEKLKKISEMR